MMRRWGFCVLLTVAAMLDLFGSAAVEGEPYRFVLKKDGWRNAEFRGLVTVDGKTRLIERASTPFEFDCEAGSVIQGYFEVLVPPDRAMRLEVHDPVYAKEQPSRKPTAWINGLRRVRFSWAQPGVGPRCFDPGTGTCPESVPSFDRLEQMLRDLTRSAQPEP